MRNSRWPAPNVRVAVLIRVAIATLATSFVVAYASDATASQTGTTTASTETAASTQTKTVTQPAQSRTVTATTTVTSPGQTTAITGNNTTVAVNPLSTTDNQSGSGIPWWGWVLIGLGVVGVAIAIFQLGRGRRGGSGGDPPAAGPPRQSGAP
jgi:hypothetical protein